MKDKTIKEEMNMYEQICALILKIRNASKEDKEEAKKLQIETELDYKYSMALFDTIKKIQCEILDEELNKYFEKMR